MYAAVAARSWLRAVPDLWSAPRAREAVERVLHLLQDAYPGHSATLLPSGTGALQLAIAAAHRGPGAPRVAAPAYACPDIGTAVVGAGGTLCLYDTDPGTLTPDLPSVERALRDGATVVVVAHLYGVVASLDAVRALATAHGAAVVEDAAQHAGGRVHGVRGGGQAAWGVLSFGRGKGLYAGGGGAVLARAPLPTGWEGATAPGAAAGARQLLVAAATTLLAHPLPFALVRRLPGLGVGDTRYHPPRPLARPVPPMARLLEAALRAEPSALAARQRRRALYRDALADVPGLALVRAPEHGIPGALREPVLGAPDRFVALAPLGVSRGYPRTLADYPALHPHLRPPLGPLTGAEQLVATLHTLPTHPLLDDATQAQLVAQLVARLRRDGAR